MAKEEAYLKGRRAGVPEGGRGEKRKGVAEKTVVRHTEDEGGGEDGLPSAARSLYDRALRNEDPDGDKAMTER